MNTNYLKTLSQTIVAKSLNDVIDHWEEDTHYTFDDLGNHTLEELGMDDLDIVEFIMNMEYLACVEIDDSFFELKKNNIFFKKKDDPNMNDKLNFQEIADYLYGLMYSSLNS